MKKLISTNYSPAMFNMAIFLLRLVFGVLMMKHGYDKLVHFSEIKVTFLNFLNIGKTTSLLLTVFAEFFCGLFILLGLFTRLASIPLIICMAVALFKVHNGDIFGDGASATLYLGAFLVLLMIGPGKASVDGISGK
jgi:putative oxidoreductase